MEQPTYIAAIDLGTSKIQLMVGKKNERGEITIVASEQEDADVCIRRGCIYNVERTSTKVLNLMRSVNKQKDPVIEKVYVGLGGQSLRLVEHSMIRDLDQDTVITHSLIQSLTDECRMFRPDFAEILEIVYPEYYLDGKYEQNPIGIQCSKIEVKFKIIVGRPSLKRTLTRCISERSRLTIAGYIISPLATAEAVLTNREKDLGCALVEFGAGVTYVSIYKNKVLKYLVTIPLGGSTITKDICGLNVTEKEAEQLKIKYGSAILDIDPKDQEEADKTAEDLLVSQKIDLYQLNNIIEARVDEILANVINQVELSGFSKQLGAGIIITGGGVELKNLFKSIMQKTGSEIRIASLHEGTNAQIIGMLALGTENCAAKPVVIEKAKPEPQQENLFAEEEIEEVQPPVRQPETRKEKKQSSGLFGGLKRKFDGFSKSLFEEEDEE